MRDPMFVVGLLLVLSASAGQASFGSPSACWRLMNEDKAMSLLPAQELLPEETTTSIPK
ncbi:hypothetical protein [Peribacillus sp. NPDC056705]|uniref:hypothetical protein n=1 Tax=Peribacillus sp. NPDC056705 TaxID=3345918 RepID=UPI003749E66A